MSYEGAERLQGYEESYWDTLVEEFIEKYSDEWEEFVFKKFEEHELGRGDYLCEMYEDR